jgi:formylmethanofuran dehydrogenase subunit B
MFVPFYSTAMLALESCDVVSLRLVKLMYGGHDAHHEAHLMVSEKINAMFEAAASVVAGGTASSVVDRYREHVAANARRLSR